MVAGLKAPPRDYSLLGNTTDKAFNAIGALATIAFAFNTGILPEMQVRIIRYMLDSGYTNYQRLKNDGETLRVDNFEPARLSCWGFNMHKIWEWPCDAGNYQKASNHEYIQGPVVAVHDWDDPIFGSHFRGLLGIWKRRLPIHPHQPFWTQASHHRHQHCSFSASSGSSSRKWTAQALR